MGAPFVFRYGEPVVVDLVVEAAEGSVPADYTVEMSFTSIVDGSVGRAMTVQLVAAAGAELAYWRGRIYPVQRAGRYLVQSKLSRNGVVEIVPDAKIVDVLKQVLV